MEAAPVAPNSRGSTGTNAKDGKVGRTYANELLPVVGGRSAQVAHTDKLDARKDWLPLSATADPAFWLKGADH